MSLELFVILSVVQNLGNRASRNVSFRDVSLSQETQVLIPVVVPTSPDVSQGPPALFLSLQKRELVRDGDPTRQSRENSRTPEMCGVLFTVTRLVLTPQTPLNVFLQTSRLPRVGECSHD